MEKNYFKKIFLILLLILLFLVISITKAITSFELFRQAHEMKEQLGEEQRPIQVLLKQDFRYFDKEAYIHSVLAPNLRGELIIKGEANQEYYKILPMTKKYYVVNEDFIEITTERQLRNKNILVYPMELKEKLLPIRDKMFKARMALIGSKISVGLSVIITSWLCYYRYKKEVLAFRIG